MKLVRFDDAIDVRGYLDIVKALIDQTISDLDHVPVAQPGNGDHASLARRAPRASAQRHGGGWMWAALQPPRRRGAFVTSPSHPKQGRGSGFAAARDPRRCRA